ncbi:MAG: Ig-like domain-containing protein [bacterium]|nr:Ig-like domain-containing protein [bacterium]
MAVKGEGSATIDAGGNATVERGVSHTFTVVLTVGASGITVDAANPTFTIPAGFTAPSSTPVATAGDVVSDGQWSAVGGATCLVTMGSSGASGQVMTVDVTTVCTVGDGGKITLTYKGTSAATMGATELTIMTADDAGVPTPAIALSGGSPTITVTDTVAPTVTVTMDDDALNVGDTSLVTFTFSEAPTGFSSLDVTVENGSIGAIDATVPLIQTAVFTPTNAITDATNIISVGTVWTDTASNTGVGDDSPSYSIDTVGSGGSNSSSQHYSQVDPISNIVIPIVQIPAIIPVVSVYIPPATASVPLFPDTGFPPAENNVPIAVFILAGILAPLLVSLIFFIKEAVGEVTS